MGTSLCRAMSGHKVWSPSPPAGGEHCGKSPPVPAHPAVSGGCGDVLLSPEQCQPKKPCSRHTGTSLPAPSLRCTLPAVSITALLTTTPRSTPGAQTRAVLCDLCSHPCTRGVHTRACTTQQGGVHARGHGIKYRGLFSALYTNPTGPVIPEMSAPRGSPLRPLRAKGWGQGASPYENYQKPK